MTTSIHAVTGRSSLGGTPTRDLLAHGVKVRGSVRNAEDAREIYRKGGTGLSKTRVLYSF